MKFNGDTPDFENPQPGPHAAVCVRIIDLGTQPNNYNGQESEPKRKLRVFWELSDKMGDGRPFLMMKQYTTSLHKKATFRKDLESWTAIKLTEGQIAKFQPDVLLGKSCMLSLIEAKDGSGKVFVDTIMKLLPSIPPPTPAGKLVFFDLDNFNQETFDGLSDKHKMTIMQSPEYRKIFAERPATSAPAATAAGGKDVDDILF